MKKKVITRFAPSPTGFLHIGGARTALFNWLFARKNAGKFLLRIEDTDEVRSTKEATNAIYKGLNWLGLNWDDKPISQKMRIDRHREIVEILLKSDMAYKCYSSQQEIKEFREHASKTGTSILFKSPWRNQISTNENKSYVVRLKTPDDGVTKINDSIKGCIEWKNNTLDDLVLLRADGTPTYMLAVVVDDFDMNISDVIRGDDHLTNTARQLLIYNAMGWAAPTFGHLPLIYGADGSKLSKRHGALGVSEYEVMGYPPEAIKNYLARLGWSHGDNEYFNISQATKWFSLDSVKKSPAMFDLNKLGNISKYHLNQMSVENIFNELTNYIAKYHKAELELDQKNVIKKNISFFKSRVKTYKELFESFDFFLKKRPICIKPELRGLLPKTRLVLLRRLTSELQNATWTQENLEELLNSFVKNENIKYVEFAQPIRIILTGEKHSPSIDVLMMVLGKYETLSRLKDVLE